MAHSDRASPWSAAVAFAVLEGGALWAIYAATGSVLAQLAALGVGAFVWDAMRDQAGSRRPFPPKSSLPSMTIRRLAELLVLLAALAAPALLFAGALEDAGHWLWFYVFFLVPQIFIWNTEAMFKRYGGSFKEASARWEAMS